MRSVVQHKAMIGLATLVLAVAVGAVAWAAPGHGSAAVPGGAVVVTSDDDGSATPGRFPGGRHGLWGVAPEELEERMEHRRDRMRQRHEALLDRVREKMSAEDRATLDALVREAEQQRDALEDAREALVETERQIRDLVGRYVPLDRPAEGGGRRDAGAAGDDASAGSR